MKPVALVPLFVVASVVINLSGFSSQANAQISKYDSMYFPTTQSLEGTRNAPRFYEVVNIDFDAKGASKPAYFTHVKQAYSKDRDTMFSLGPHSNSFSFSLAVQQTSSVNMLDLTELHASTLKRLRLQNVEAEQKNMTSNFTVQDIAIVTNY